MSSLTPEQRGRLLGAKLSSVVAGHLEVDSIAADAQAIAGGAGLIVDGAGWVLLDADPLVGLGAAVVWAERSNVSALRLIVDRKVCAEADQPWAPGVLARRASLFGDTSIFELDERTLSPAIAAPFEDAIEPDPEALDTAMPLREAGAEIVVERGEVTAEVLGLQVARVVRDDERGHKIEMGVGKFDQYAFSMLEGTVRDLEESIPRVIDTVRRHRLPGAVPHPLNRLGRERLLRNVLLEDPQLVGVDALVVIEPVLPRENLRDRSVALAQGETADGAVLVAATVGVDLDVVPTLADARLRHRARTGDDAPVRGVVVTPARDQYPALSTLAAALAEPVELIAVEGPWA